MSVAKPWIEVAGAADVPLRLRVARLGVLAGDRAHDGRVAGRGRYLRSVGSTRPLPQRSRHSRSTPRPIDVQQQPPLVRPPRSAPLNLRPPDHNVAHRTPNGSDACNPTRSSWRSSSRRPGPAQRISVSGPRRILLFVGRGRPTAAGRFRRTEVRQLQVVTMTAPCRCLPAPRGTPASDRGRGLERVAMYPSIRSPDVRPETLKGERRRGRLSRVVILLRAHEHVHGRVRCRNGHGGPPALPRVRGSGWPALQFGLFDGLTQGVQALVRMVECADRRSRWPTQGRRPSNGICLVGDDPTRAPCGRAVMVRDRVRSWLPTASGKGCEPPDRDALIAANSDPQQRGQAFRRASRVRHRGSAR